MDDTVRVIGAGFGRTGTLSLKAALEQLGFGPCYHMYELLGHLDHAQHWNTALDGDISALRTPLEGYRATVDWPGCAMWRELCDLYPDAKVVLSVRPPERWYASFRETIGALLAAGHPADVPEGFAPVFEMSDRLVRDRGFGPDFDVDDVDGVIAAYEAHNDAVRGGVASERLLEFDVTAGWAPLCAFLDTPIPDTEFPNVNDREQFRALFRLNAAAERYADDGQKAQARFRQAASQTSPS